jgi:hypothetical protein
MKMHPYLRAFLAGAFVPTLVLPILLTVFIVVRLVLHCAVPIERGMVFPMALVPSIFGLWNMLWLKSHGTTHMPLGLHGALLPLIGAPVGASVASLLGVLALEPSGVRWFDVLHVPYALVACVFCAAMAGYYLVWKYVVGFVNRTLEIA